MNTVELFLGFLQKIINRRIVNKYYLSIYIDLPKEKKSETVEDLSMAFICGITELKDLQRMYPMFTRERIRQMLLKAERVGKAIYRGER